MREILFRGKRLDNDEWVEGYLGQDTLIGDNKTWLGYVIRSVPQKLWDCDWFEVDPSTVGQFTGLKDTNGKRIFEGDIFEWGYAGVKEFRYVVVYDANIASFVGERHFGFVALNGIDIEIIGNIHDSELLEVTPDE